MTAPKHYIEFNHRAITGIGIMRGKVIVRQIGGTVTITDPKECSTMIQWVREAKSFAKNRDEVCSYIEYMLDYGQYEC